jgi:AcrR family transcriptional regulator
MRTANPEKIAEQKDQIIAAAIRTFSRLGLAASSTDDICKEAGISPGRLYYYFKSRDALVDAIIQRLYASTLTLVTEQFATEDLVTGIVASHMAVEDNLARIGFTPSLLREMLNVAERDPKVRRVFRGGFQQGAALIKSTLTREKDARRLRPETDIETLSLAVSLALTGVQVSEGAVTGRISAEQLRKVVRMIVQPWMVDAAETSLKRSKRS